MESRSSVQVCSVCTHSVSTGGFVNHIIVNFYVQRLLCACLLIHLTAVDHNSPGKSCGLLRRLHTSLKIMGSYNRTLRNECAVITDELSGVAIIFYYFIQ